jgi:hypothetical protein
MEYLFCLTVRSLRLVVERRCGMRDPIYAFNSFVECAILKKDQYSNISYAWISQYLRDVIHNHVFELISIP